MRRFNEHFDGRNNNASNSRWTVWDSQAGIVNSPNFGVENGYCAQLNSFLGNARPIETTSFFNMTEFFIGFHFRTTITDNSLFATVFPFLQMNFGAGFTDADLRLNNARRIEIRINNALVATGTTQLDPNTGYHVQLHLLINDTSGVAELRIQNVSEVTVSGIDTKPSTGTTLTALRFSTNGNGGIVYVDNIVMNDTDNTDGLGNTSWPGILNFFAQVPIGDGTNGVDNEWTASLGGSHFAEVDDAPANDDVDYLKSVTNLQKQRLTFPATGLVNANVRAVLFDHLVRNVSDGAIKLGVKEGGTETLEAASQSLLSSYKTKSVRFQSNPRTSSAWLLAEALVADGVIQAQI